MCMEKGVRVYVNQKKQCPEDAVLRRGPKGGTYYYSEERGNPSEVGELIGKFESFLNRMTKSEEDVIANLVKMITDQILPAVVAEDLDIKSLAEKVETEIESRIDNQSPADVAKEVTEDLIIEEKLVMREQIGKVKFDRVYVSDEDQVPESYQAMRDENDDVYYERVDSLFIDSGRTSQKAVKKSLVYVGGPDEVPDGYTPQQGEMGGWYYDTQEGPSGIGESVTESLGEMVEDIVSLLTGGEDRGQMDPSQEDLREAAERMRQRQSDLMRSEEFLKALESELEDSPLNKEDVISELEKELRAKRTYISDPSEAPEGANVQEGARGGYYYEEQSDGLSSENITQVTDWQAWEENEEGSYERAEMVVEALHEDGYFDEISGDANLQQHIESGDMSPEGLMETLVDDLFEDSISDEDKESIIDMGSDRIA